MFNSSGQRVSIPAVATSTVACCDRSGHAALTPCPALSHPGNRSPAVRRNVKPRPRFRRCGGFLLILLVSPF
ncbi:hypothetical protein KCP76_26320 (plasmid) [Salmonella enterica subsp. enterica serovar Weltevreden]|nr:hypothetical protein KCP76_26320 [Salmonella enterica subsp. enterica serovar Weltevreden]QUI99490.1 hypothetical protein KCP74_25740 [Salmonella enterica subsp. enterica]QUJ01259.1 hypothetical protein KCP73_27065 [Salmonella enterica subsp. enterica]